MTLASTTLGWRLVNKAMPKEWTIPSVRLPERLREKHGVTRVQQDQFAADSHNLSAAVWDEGFYDNLVAPVRGRPWFGEGIRPGCTAEKLAA